MTDVERAYIAGFLDGDGCISIKVQKRMTSGVTYSFHPRVSLTNCDSSALEKMKEIVGYGTLYKKPNFNPKKWKDCYDLGFNFREAGKLLVDLLPCLIVKKPQAILFLEFLTHYEGGRQSGVSPDILKKRLSLTYQIQFLNKRGKDVQTD